MIGLLRPIAPSPVLGATKTCYHGCPRPGAPETGAWSEGRLAWTDDLYRGNGVGACENVLTVLRGQVPGSTVNREVTERPGFQRKLQSLRTRWTALAGP